MVEVECLRTLDLLRLEGALTDQHLADAREATYRVLERMHIVEPTGPVLRRAAQPMAAPLGTLDAIHLATAARSNGLRVLGV